jgi:hypothetical protein
MLLLFNFDEISIEARSSLKLSNSEETVALAIALSEIGASKNFTFNAL